MNTEVIKVSYKINTQTSQQRLVQFGEQRALRLSRLSSLHISWEIVLIGVTAGSTASCGLSLKSVVPTCYLLEMQLLFRETVCFHALW